MKVWVGMAEVRQLPGSDHAVELSGKGAYTWITCWAEDATGYRRKVSEVMEYYGLFAVEIQEMARFAQAEEAGTVTDKLYEQ